MAWNGPMQYQCITVFPFIVINISLIVINLAILIQTGIAFLEKWDDWNWYCVLMNIHCFQKVHSLTLLTLYNHNQWQFYVNSAFSSFERTNFFCFKLEYLRKNEHFEITRSQLIIGVIKHFAYYQSSWRSEDSMIAPIMDESAVTLKISQPKEIECSFLRMVTKI